MHIEYKIQPLILALFKCQKVHSFVTVIMIIDCTQEIISFSIEFESRKHHTISI